MATVDVIIPAYNTSKFLPYAIESVIAQDFTDWQIVLVDDGSTDNTAQVIAPYRQQLGSKFTYVYQQNRGLPAARNTAIRSSSSELLALLDADDVWMPWRLSESVKLMRSRPSVALTYGGITHIDSEGRPGRTFEGSEKNAASHIAAQIYTRQIHLPCPTVTFRRDCLSEVGLFDESMRATEDRDLWLRIAQRHEVAFIPKAIAYYRLSPQSMSTDPDRMLRAQLQFIHKHYGEKDCGFWNRRIALAGAYKLRAEALRQRKQPFAAATNSLRSLALYPFSSENLKSTLSMALACTGLRRAPQS